MKTHNSLELLNNKLNKSSYHIIDRIGSILFPNSFLLCFLAFKGLTDLSLGLDRLGSLEKQALD
jgi:hypothetical protein